MSERPTDDNVSSRNTRAGYFLRSALMIIIFSCGHISALVLHPQNEDTPPPIVCSPTLSTSLPQEIGSLPSIEHFSKSVDLGNQGDTTTAGTGFDSFKEYALWSMLQFIIAFYFARHVVLSLPWRRLSMSRFLFTQLVGVAGEIILVNMPTISAANSVADIARTFRLMLLGAVIFMKYASKYTSFD
mmetsp:Transcript_11519/g.23614  ORF Transcript_11519/g.23614 Transcript_11519/m.23614 type:complete len:186 (+) Transcript_11519:523-1080(+)